MFKICNPWGFGLNTFNLVSVQQTLNLFRVQPSYLKLKEEIHSGAIGEVFDVNSQFGVQIEADRVAKKEFR